MSQEDAGQEQPTGNGQSRRHFSEEMAEWFRLLREYWFQDSEKTWNRTQQFVFTFLGSLSFFVMLPFFTLNTGILEFQSNIVLEASILFPMYIIVFLASAFYGAMLAWVPRKSGPIRLYLSGMALPALVMFVASFPIRYGMVS